MRAASAHAKDAELSPTKRIGDRERVVSDGENGSVAVGARPAVAGAVEGHHLRMQPPVQIRVRAAAESRTWRSVQQQEWLPLRVTPGREGHGSTVGPLDVSL